MMGTIEAGTRISFKNVLYLTDFSKSSTGALPFVVGIARKYGARVHALHVLIPPIPEAYHDAVEADRKLADAEMAKVNPELAGVSHDTAVVSGAALWPEVAAFIRDQQVDLIVLGTHGRTGVPKLLLGSFAEEIFRHSSVPVLTIGPDVPRHVHPSPGFRSVLFATDFSESSLTGAPFAISLAEENAAQLVLLTVVTESGERHQAAISRLMHQLDELVPGYARMRQRPKATVRCGEVAALILETAAEYNVDLIVLGVRSAAEHLGVATHLERATAHKVVAHARCPVLTVRGNKRDADEN
jgi:nucleotide-binding universal stress UspA family protein